jgi:hypothetical protein
VRSNEGGIQRTLSFGYMVFSKYTVTYMLKARTVETEKQPHAKIEVSRHVTPTAVAIERLGKHIRGDVRHCKRRSLRIHSKRYMTRPTELSSDRVILRPSVVTYDRLRLVSEQIPCGGGVEYLHRSPANSKRQQKGNPVAGSITEPPSS